MTKYFFSGPRITTSFVFTFILGVWLNESVKDYIVADKGVIANVISLIYKAETEISRLVLLLILAIILISILYLGLTGLNKMKKYFSPRLKQHMRFTMEWNGEGDLQTRMFPDCSNIHQFMPPYLQVESEVSKRFPWAWTFLVIRYGSSTNGFNTRDIDLSILVLGDRPNSGLVADKAGKHDGRSPLIDVEFCDYSLALRLATEGDPYYHHVATGKLEAGNKDLFVAFVSVCKSALVPKEKVFANAKLRYTSLMNDFFENRSDLGTAITEGQRIPKPSHIREDSTSQLYANENKVNVLWSIKAYLLCCNIMQLIIIEKEKKQLLNHENLLSLGEPNKLISKLKSLCANDEIIENFPGVTLQEIVKTSEEIVANYKTRSNEGKYLAYAVLKEKLAGISSTYYLENPS